MCFENYELIISKVGREGFIELKLSIHLGDWYICAISDGGYLRLFLGMRPTESAAGAQNWGEKLFREIYLDKDRVSVSCENELLEFFNGSMLEDQMNWICFPHRTDRQNQWTTKPHFVTSTSMFIRISCICEEEWGNSEGLRLSGGSDKSLAAFGGVGS